MRFVQRRQARAVLALAGLLILAGVYTAGTIRTAAQSLSSRLRATVAEAAPAYLSQEPPGGGMMSGGMMSGSGMMGGSSGGGMMGGGMMPSTGMPGMDMGKMMGAMMANSPGDRVSVEQARALGSTAPAGATVDQANNQIIFRTQDVRLTVLASPDDGPDMTFRIAGLADPTIIIPTGATLTLQFVQAEADTSHGWLLTAAQPPFSSMPMMDTRPAFSGSSAMPLGDPTDAGMHSETIAFVAGAAGQYSYLCNVMGHAQQGMVGTLIVQ